MSLDNSGSLNIMYILNLPEGRRLTRFRPPLIVQREGKKRKEMSTDPQTKKREVDHKTSQSVTMETNYEVKHH